MARDIQPVRVPLLEAVIEIRFPGEARIEHSRADFQDLIRDRFPDLAVPLAKETQAPALQHYRFVNEAQTEFVGLALNSFAHSTREYPGWEDFLRSTRTLWEQIPGFAPRSLTRVGVRYINLFEDDMLDNFVLGSENHLFGPVREHPELHRSQTVLAVDGDILTVNFEYRPADRKIALDFDCAAETVAPEDLWESVERLHTTIEQRFFSVLSSQYRHTLLGNEGSDGSS